MRTPDRIRIETRPPDLSLPGGRRLRLLSARQVLEARREALALAKGEEDLALCSNACLVARSLRDRRGRRVFSSGRAVLEGCTPEEIQELARRWSQMDREENPGPGMDRDRLDQLRQSLAESPRQRLRWRVLRAFQALPTEGRVREMSDRDYLWCALNLLLDEEEAAALLCPACRAEAEKPRCPACGRETGETVREENPAFDWARYRQLRGEGGEAP